MEYKEILKHLENINVYFEPDEDDTGFTYMNGKCWMWGFEEREFYETYGWVLSDPLCVLEDYYREGLYYCCDNENDFTECSKSEAWLQIKSGRARRKAILVRQTKIEKQLEKLSILTSKWV